MEDVQRSKMEEEEEKRKIKWPLMKAAQIVEFQMQALVYRYIEAGLRVPHYLLLPIWNSLALSSSSNHLSNLMNHPSSLLEPEPTRCRRTDGKKWRCGNKVLPFQKYCERHMHRGRKRSRKLVESSCEVASPSAKQDNTHGLNSVDESQTVCPETVSVSSNAQVVTIASLPSDRSYEYDDGIIKQREQSAYVPAIPLQGGETSLPCVQKFFPEVSDISLEPAATFSSIRKDDIIARGEAWKNMYVNGNYFSPGTALHDRDVFRLQNDNEPGRCRRTDGKKWRCSRDVLSGEKYCDKHMHRGTKKKHPVDTTNSHENSGAETAARSVSCKDGDARKLSVSVMGIPLSRVKSTSSCSSDTTITDTALRGEEDNEEVLSLCSSGV